MVIFEVLTEDPEQMPIAQHDEVIKAFSSDRSDQPLGISVLPGRSGCGQHLFDAHAAKSFAHNVPGGADAVADEEALLQSGVRGSREGQLTESVRIHS